MFGHKTLAFSASSGLQVCNNSEPETVVWILIFLPNKPATGLYEVIKMNEKVADFSP